MIEFNYTIKDPQGIHARPAGQLVKATTSYPCSITITKGEKTIDAKRVMALMSLGIKSGETIVIKVDGENEDTAAKELAEFLAENL